MLKQVMDLNLNSSSKREKMRSEVTLLGPAGLLDNCYQLSKIGFQHFLLRGT